LNNDNPFISKPSQAEVYSCEGKIITLKSTQRSVIGRQFFIKCFSFPSFGRQIINPWHWLSNPRHEELHNELFLNNDNPFISKPSQAEVYSCEGKIITLQECLGA
jgi:hypothetical protein